MPERAAYDDGTIEEERRKHLRGIVRVKLEVLDFGSNQPMELDTKQLEHLKSCFEKDECRRLEPQNHIPAIIDQQSLTAAILLSGISAGDLLRENASEYPELMFSDGFRLECLHGKHRIQAAKEVLTPGDRWWIIDLYISDLNTELKSCLKEEFFNQRVLSDGEIYRMIRLYQFQQNEVLERRWKTRLLGSRLKNLNELLKHDGITAAFDDLLVIPGLWSGMRITTLHAMLATKCDEEILHYLGHIKKVWSDLVQGDRTAMSKIDEATVKAVELKAPRASTADRNTLYRQIQAGEIFSAFDVQERIRIWKRLQETDGLIPSLFTFFGDLQYLRVCVDCVKRLTKVSPRESIWRAMQRCFTSINQVPNQVKIQVTEHTFNYRPGTIADQVYLGYCQIFAFAMRHYPDMPREAVRTDLITKCTAKADQTVLTDFAHLAHQLGFDSPEIITLKQNSLLTHAQKGWRPGRPLGAADGPGLARDKRYGVPHCSSYEETRNVLFIDHLHSQHGDQAENITSFFVCRSVYLAFFGKPVHTRSVGLETDPEKPTFSFTAQSSTATLSHSPRATDSNRSESNDSDRWQETPKCMDEETDQSQTFCSQPEEMVEDHVTDEEEHIRSETEGTEGIKLRESLSQVSAGSEWNLKWERLRKERLQPEQGEYVRPERSSKRLRRGEIGRR